MAGQEANIPISITLTVKGAVVVKPGDVILLAVEQLAKDEYTLDQIQQMATKLTDFLGTPVVIVDGVKEMVVKHKDEAKDEAEDEAKPEHDWNMPHRIDAMGPVCPPNCPANMERPKTIKTTAENQPSNAINSQEEARKEQAKASGHPLASLPCRRCGRIPGNPQRLACADCSDYVEMLAEIRTGNEDASLAPPVKPLTRRCPSKSVHASHNWRTPDLESPSYHCGGVAGGAQ